VAVLFSHRLSLRLVYVLSATVLVAVAGVSLVLAPVPPPGGVSKNHAIKLAHRYASVDERAQLMAATAGRMGEFTDTSSTLFEGRRWVWAIAMATWSGSCGAPDVPGETTCPPTDYSKMVLIDYFSGALIKIEIPSPIRPG
jgi:hypothetical protein